MIVNTNGFEANKIILNGMNNNSLHIQTMLDNIKRTFKLNPSYFTITKNNDLNTVCDCWIVDDLTAYKKVSSDKHIVMYPDQTINKGDIINWNGQQWLVREKDMQTFPYDEGTIQYCNNILKTILPNGELINYPCIVEKIGKNNLQVEDFNNIEVQKSQLILVVQNNNDTIQLKPSWRLIFGTNVYKILSYDDITNVGITEYKIIADGERVGKDNWTTGIADNSVQEKPTQIGNIVINGSKILKVGNTGVWNVQLDDGSAVSDNYTFTVSDTNKVNIVSQDGKAVTLKGLFYGQVKLTATCTTDSTKSCFIIINVQNGW